MHHNKKHWSPISITQLYHNTIYTSTTNYTLYFYSKSRAEDDIKLQISCLFGLFGIGGKRKEGVEDGHVMEHLQCVNCELSVVVRVADPHSFSIIRLYWGLLANAEGTMHADCCHPFASTAPSEHTQYSYFIRLQCSGKCASSLQYAVTH